MLRLSLAAFGLTIALGAPAFDAGDSRYALVLDAPWSHDQTVDAGREAGGMLVRTGWHNSLFYFPAGVARPASLAGAIIVPIRMSEPECASPDQTELS